MKRALSVVILVIFTTMLSGCILLKTPIAKDVSMDYGEHMTFSVIIFPPNATYTWTLNGEPLSNSGSSYDYTAKAGDHILEVKAEHSMGTDVQTWNIQLPSLPDTVIELLDSIVTIPAGSFMMGSEDDEYGYAQYTTPVHQVTLQAFNIGAFEVTQAQFQAVMRGTNPSFFQGPSYPDSANRPVESVGWGGAQGFCNELSAMTGRTFKLPSEAQWEYACRAGTTTLYSFGDSESLLGDHAWWSNNSDGTGGPLGTHPVGTKLPNPWGLYDMHGNVWEWCFDSWHDNYIGAPTDGSAWQTSMYYDRLFRGGCWSDNSPGIFRSAYRSDEGGLLSSIGFRVAEVR